MSTFHVSIPTRIKSAKAWHFCTFSGVRRGKSLCTTCVCGSHASGRVCAAKTAGPLGEAAEECAAWRIRALALAVLGALFGWAGLKKVIVGRELGTEGWGVLTEDGEG